MNWTIESRAFAVDAILSRAPVLPVLSVDSVEQGVQLAQTLVAAGLPVLELTLRTAAALDALRAMVKAVPGAVIGAGTVLDAEQLQAVAEAGAAFAIAPGCTETLYDAADAADIPLIPAIATASELMRGMERGHSRFKFFPAVAAGGIATLKAFAGPFAQVRFCPTGGIDAASAPGFLALRNVVTVGGSWMVPGDALAAGDWPRIAALARACVQA